MTEWRTHAECRGTDTTVCFPASPTQTAEARKICARCTVSHQCLEFILTISDEDDRAGVFAGTSARQRRAKRRERNLHPVSDPLPHHTPIPLRWDSESEKYLVVSD